MRSGSLPHRLTVILSLVLLTLGLTGSITNVNASHYHVRLIRINYHYFRYRSMRNHRYHRRHFRRYHRRVRRYRIRHYYTRPYPTVNDRIRWHNQHLRWSSHPKRHRETVKSIYGPKVTFKTLCFVPTKVANDHFLVQSLNVLPDGRYGFIGYGHNPLLRHGRDLTRIAKIDFRHHRFKISKAFNGGHGQALAYNPVQHSLWALNDIGGPIHKGKLVEVSTNSLKPKHQIRFRLRPGDNLGDTLTFDYQNHVYNENLIRPSAAIHEFRNGMIILHRGILNHRHAKFTRISQGIRHAPSELIQGIAYNHRTRRLYMEANDVIISVPINRLGHLRPHDVKETILRQRREYEGISFDRRGHAYILMNNPKEIMRSTRVF